MLPILFSEIYESALAHANGFVEFKRKEQGKPFSENHIKSIMEDNVWNTEYADMVALGLVLGSLESYHEQLRKVLQTQGIEIGEFILDDSAHL